MMVLGITLGYTIKTVKATGPDKFLGEFISVGQRRRGGHLQLCRTDLRHKVVLSVPKESYVWTAPPRPQAAGRNERCQ